MEQTGVGSFGALAPTQPWTVSRAEPPTLTQADPATFRQSAAAQAFTVRILGRGLRSCSADPQQGVFQVSVGDNTRDDQVVLNLRLQGSPQPPQPGGGHVVWISERKKLPVSLTLRPTSGPPLSIDVIVDFLTYRERGGVSGDIDYT
jgi:hypothetical protein